MGRSGASRDMLHFEIRYNGKPVDPLLYLARRGITAYLGAERAEQLREEAAAD